MIKSSGYASASEVEEASASIRGADCGVIGVPDPDKARSPRPLWC